MSRKPQHHVPEIFCTVNDRLEKTMKAAEVTCEVKTVPPKEKNDVVSLHHSLYAPSSLPAIALCPARVRMSLGLPELPASEDADEGRLLHYAIAFQEGRKGLGNEQVEVVDECVNLILELAGNNGDVFHEEKVSVIGSDFSELTFGTCDCLIRFPEKAVILDWKTGRNEVEEAANNLQLATYAVGVAQKYGYDTIECHVFQPRIYHHSSYTFTDIPAVLASIEAVIARSKVAEWVFNPCEDACRYCRAKFTCKPCLASLSGLPVVATGPEASQQDLAVLMPSLIPAAKQAAKLSEAILDKAKDLLTQGIPVPGYYLKDGNEVRFVADITKAFEGTKDLIPQDEFLKLCSVSVGAYEEKFIEKFKAVSSQFADMTLDECKEEFSKRVYGSIAKKQNKPSLAEVKVKK